MERIVSRYLRTHAQATIGTVNLWELMAWSNGTCKPITQTTTTRTSGSRPANRTQQNEQNASTTGVGGNERGVAATA